MAASTAPRELRHRAPYLDRTGAVHRWRMEVEHAPGRWTRRDLWPRTDRRARNPLLVPEVDRYPWEIAGAGKFTARLASYAPRRAAQLAAEILDTPGRAVPFRELVDRVLGQSEGLGRSRRTDTRYQGVARRFREWAEAGAPEALVDARAITAEVVERFLGWRRDSGVSWTTLKSDWACLRVLLSRAVRDGHLAELPRPEIRWQAKVEEDRRAGRIHDGAAAVLELVPRFLRAAEPPAVRALLTFLALTGARIGEVLPRNEGEGLRWKHITTDDAGGMTARLVGGKGRARGERVIPVPREAAALLLALPGDATGDTPVWPLAGVRYPWAQLRRAIAAELAVQVGPRAAELARAAAVLRVHDLRHYASHYWRSKGVPDRHIDRLLGHRTPVVAARYAAADVTELAASLAAAEGEGS